MCEVHWPTSQVVWGSYFECWAVGSDGGVITEWNIPYYGEVVKFCGQVWRFIQVFEFLPNNWWYAHVSDLILHIQLAGHHYVVQCIAHTFLPDNIGGVLDFLIGSSGRCQRLRCTQWLYGLQWWLFIGSLDPWPVSVVFQYNSQVSGPCGVVLRASEFGDSELLSHPVWLRWLVSQNREQIWMMDVFGKGKGMSIDDRGVCSQWQGAGKVCAILSTGRALGS